jgi:hypothetical protein
MSKYVTTVALAMGDVVCIDRANPGQVTQATATALDTAEGALGVATAAFAANALADIADSGTVATAITGLGAGAISLVGVVNHVCTRITAPGQNDYILGMRRDGPPHGPGTQRGPRAPEPFLHRPRFWSARHRRLGA